MFRVGDARLHPAAGHTHFVDDFAVLHDMAYPGWVVYVDGMPQEPLRANVLFMAAAVPAGRHAVTFAYEPLAPGQLWSVIAGNHD